MKNWEREVNMIKMPYMKLKKDKLKHCFKALSIILLTKNVFLLQSDMRQNLIFYYPLHDYFMYFL